MFEIADYTLKGTNNTKISIKRRISMKKIICIITTVFIILNIISVQTFAANEPTMASIADSTINVSVSVNTDGTEAHTYTNIDSFINSVRYELPQKK